MNSAPLSGKFTIVTGASSPGGIGRAIAQRFAAEGAAVLLVAEGTRAQLDEAKALCAAQPNAGRIVTAQIDLGATDGPAEMIAVAEGLFGRVDVLVNNAGVTKDGLLMRMSEADWDTVLDTNLRGAFLFTKAFTRTFLKQRSGRIINLASVIGLVGNAGQCNYAASKAGLIGFTKSVAKEFGSRGVTCNAIAPGFIATDMTAALDDKLKEALLKQIPLGALGEPDDIAEAALYLAGPGGRYVTGQVLTVDGGMVM